MPIILCWGQIKTLPIATNYLHDLKLVPNHHQIQHLYTPASQQDTVLIIDAYVCRERQSSSVYTLSSDSHILLRSSTHQFPSSSGAPLPPPTPVTVNPPQPLPQLPQVERYSGQCQGESMEAFFQRHTQQHQLALQCEPP